MLKTTEAQLQHTVIELAQALGWLAAHFRAAQTSRGWRTPVEGDGAGFPDLVLARGARGNSPGRLIFAELKSDRGTLSPTQVRWLDTLRASGCEVYVWRPADIDDITQILR